MSEITKRLKLKVYPVCRNPVYIHWITPAGFPAYWLFNINQTAGIEIEDGDEVIIDNETYIKFKESRNTLRINSGQVTLDEIKGLKTLYESTYVWILVRGDKFENGEQWFPIQIQSVSGDIYETDSNLFEFECEILFDPNLNIKR